MACIKLSPIGNVFAAGYATAKLYKISPTDVLAEEGSSGFHPLEAVMSRLIRRPLRHLGAILGVLEEML